MVLLLMFALGKSGIAQSPAPYTLRLDTTLVLVDLTAINTKTFVPDTNSSRSDIDLQVDGRSAKIVSFDQGTGAAVRPIVLWLVVQCAEDNTVDGGSKFFAGKARSLAAGLSHMNPADRVAIAEWCNDGSHGISLRPTSDASGAIKALDQVLSVTKSTSSHNNQSGEVALLAMLDDIDNASESTQPTPLPVLIFLHGDHTATPTQDLDRAVEKLNDTAAIGFVLNNGGGPPVNLSSGVSYETPYVLSNLAVQTGGAVIHVERNAAETGYSDAIASILDRLHARYQLSFKPRPVDNDYHTILVKLTRHGKVEHRNLELRFRSGYRLTPATR